MNKMGDGVLVHVGVFVGRFNPIHMGHQRTIDDMIQNHGTNSVLFIGSANSPLSFRNLFTYKERREFIRTLYPQLKVMPLADQENDNDWLESLIDMIDVAFPFYYHINLYCGDLIDLVNFPHSDKISIKIIDRYEEQVCSGTEVREHIMMERQKQLRTLIDNRIVLDVYLRGRARLDAMLRGKK